MNVAIISLLMSVAVLLVYVYAARQARRAVDETRRVDDATRCMADNCGEGTPTVVPAKPGTPLMPAGPRGSPTWTLVLAITGLLATAAARHESIQSVNANAKRQTPLIVFDLRPKSPVHDGQLQELSAEEFELDSAVGERRGELQLALTPDSLKALANSSTHAIYISVLATPPAAKLRFWIGDMDTIRPFLEKTFQKPKGVEHLMLRWDLTDSTGARIRAGYRWLGARSESASAHGWLHVTESR